jgi:hypothetical protein
MNSDDFRRLVAAGLDTEQIAVVMEMMDRDARAHAEAEEARKAKGRARVQRWRDHRNVTETQPKVTELLTGADAPVEDKTSNLDIEPQDSKKDKTPSGDVAEFKAELSPDLDADRLNALIKHRRTKRAQITRHAAKLFRRDAEACGLSVGEAADTCISRNWITVKADWLDKPNARGSPQQQAPSLADVFAIAARTPRHADQPEPPEDRSSFQQAIPHLSAVRSG